MREHTDAWTERLSEYVDGELTGTERESLERHLGTCVACRGVVEELRAVRERARALPDRRPARDLWPGIEAAIEESKVVELPRAGAAATGTSRGGGGRRGRSGIFLSVPQLAAAAVVLMTLTGGGAWLLAVDSASRAPVVAVAVEAPSDPVVTARLDDPRFEDQAAEVERLAALLEKERGRLDPSTVRILEKNLAVIDRAIRESYEALDVDPGNEFVEEHLRRAVERKVTYLQEATALLEMTD